MFQLLFLRFHIVFKAAPRILRNRFLKTADAVQFFLRKFAEQFLTDIGKFARKAVFNAKRFFGGHNPFLPVIILQGFKGNKPFSAKPFQRGRNRAFRGVHKFFQFGNMDSPVFRNKKEHDSLRRGKPELLRAGIHILIYRYGYILIELYNFLFRLN